MKLEQFFFYDTFRPGQAELAESVYNACVNGKKLVAEAVSGFGKTAAVLAGSLLAAHENHMRIVYACRTKRQIFRVMEELANIQKHTKVSGSDISSKYDYCLLMKKSHLRIPSESFKWYCNFNTTNNLCSYFLNASLNEAVVRLAQEKNTNYFPHSTLLDKSEEIHVCPYEVAKLAAINSGIVVTTYHYALDEASRSLLFGDGQLNPSTTTLILDEAHNLKDFIRNISTTTLSFEELEMAVLESREFYLEDIHRALTTLNGRVRDYCSTVRDWHIDKESFLKALCKEFDRTWLSNLSFELATCAGVAWYSISTGKNLPHSVIRVGEFLTNLLSSITAETIFLTRSENSLSLVNVDSAKFFVNATQKFRSLILLSATLSPSQLFLRSIGLDATTEMRKIETGSTLEITTLLDTGVTTKFKFRTPEMYSKIASRVITAYLAQPGGIGVFVPSYSVLDALAPLIKSGISCGNLLTEKRNMTNDEASRIIESFKSDRHAILLAIQGGRFSEGEDFRGEQMSISIVVGLSLPPPSPTLFAEYSYTSKLNRKDSYLLISLLPALRKAFQSAGRHIRNPNKKGMVFLLDSRFDDQKIIGLMPSWLKKNLIIKDFSNTEIHGIVEGVYR